MIRPKKVAVDEKKQQPAKKISESILRLQNDLKSFYDRTADNKQLTNVSLQFPNPDSKNPLHIVIQPQTGFYKNTRLTFVYDIPEEYPYKSPRVECLQKVFHPNLDPQTRVVCLSILKDNWKPNNELIEVIYGLWQIIECLSQNDIEKPLDARAAELIKTDPEKFQQIVITTLKGKSFEGRQFDNVWIGGK